MTLNDRPSVDVAETTATSSSNGMDRYPIDRAHFYMSLYKDIENHRGHFRQLSKIVSEVHKAKNFRVHHDHKAYGMLGRYTALLERFDTLYASQKTDFSLHLAKLRKEDGASLLGVNRAEAKLTELVRQSRHCGEPLFEMGCPPGYFMQAYQKAHRCRVVGAAFFERLERDLTEKQVSDFRQFVADNASSKSTFVFLDLDAFCPVCVDLAARACHEEHIKLFVSDVGFSLDYDSPPCNWFEYAAFVVDTFATYRKIHPESESAIGDMDFVFKMQEFGACVRHYGHLDAFITYVTDAGYDTLFRKPTGSWAGNDEMYVILEKRRDKKKGRGFSFSSSSSTSNSYSLYRALDSLKEALTHMCNYRRRALESFYVSQNKKKYYYASNHGRERSPQGSGTGGQKRV